MTLLMSGRSITALASMLVMAASVEVRVRVPGGWDQPPLPGAARGTMASLVQQHEGVFEAEMLAALDAEAPELFRLQAGRNR